MSGNYADRPPDRSPARAKQPGTAASAGDSTSTATAGGRHIFICYAHADAEYVYPEAERLIRGGFDIWYDQGIPTGSDWREQIASAIEGAAVVLVFLSPQALASAECQREVHYAVEHRLPLLVVHLEPMRMQGGMAIAVAGQQALVRHELDTADFQSQLDSQLATFVAPRAGGGSRLGHFAQRRRVVIMVCDLMLPTGTSDEQAHGLRDAYVQTCRRELDLYGGHVVNVLDGRITALFGYPRSQEDNQHRAALAADQLQRSFAAFRKRVAAMANGHLDQTLLLHVADVVARTDGDQVMVTGQGLRTTLRTATGLVTPGIHVTRDSAPLFTADLCSIQDSDSPGVMAITDVLPRRRNRHVAPVRDPDFVGRALELQEFARLWRPVPGGHGAAAVVTGPAGIGKSRLLRAFRESLDEDYLWLVCVATEYTRLSPLEPFTRLLNWTWGIKAEDSTEERMAKAKRALVELGMTTDQRTEVVAELLGLTDAGQAAGTRDQRRDALTGFLVDWVYEQTRHQPVILVIEDMHWLDQSSIEMIEELALSVEGLPLFMLITSREEPLPDSVLGNQARHLPLGPLDTNDVQILVRSQLGDSTSEELVQKISEQADGLPLFIEELARSYGMSGQDGHLPHRLQDLLLSRVDMVGDHKPVVQCAAAIGREFSPKLLAPVLATTVEQLETALNAMMSLQLIYRRGIRNRATFQFRHSLMRDVAYQSMVATERAAIHGRIADTMADQGGYRAEIIATHLRRANRWQDAANQFHQAGTHALEQSAYQEARQHLRAAADCLDQGGLAGSDTAIQRFNLLIDQFVAESALGGYSSPAAAKLLEQARGLSLDLGPSDAAASYIQKMCFLYTQRGDVRTALNFAEQIALLDPEGTRPMVQQRAIEAQGATALLTGEPSRAAALLGQGVTLAEDRLEATDLIDSRVFCRAFLAAAEILLGNLDNAIRIAADSISVARSLHAPLNEACALETVAKVWIVLHDHEEAGRLGQATMELAQSNHWEFFGEMGQVVHGWARACQGDIDAGREEMLSAIAALDAIGTRRERTLHLSLLAEVEILAGNIAAANARVEEALSVAASTGEAVWMPELLRQHAVLAAPGDAFRERISKAAQDASERNMSIFLLRILTSWLRREPENNEVRSRLQHVLSGFPARHDHADFVAARRLLSTNSNSPKTQKAN